jgi:hypothetical protein
VRAARRAFPGTARTKGYPESGKVADGTSLREDDLKSGVSVMYVRRSKYLQ